MKDNSPPSIAHADDIDLKLAARELADGRRALESAHALVDPGARRHAIKAALSKLALATRAIDEVIDRRSDPKRTRGPRGFRADEARFDDTELEE